MSDENNRMLPAISMIESGQGDIITNTTTNTTTNTNIIITHSLLELTIYV